MKRVFTIDLLKVLALVNMIVYHGVWDMIYIFGTVKCDLYTLPFIIWERYICISFIFLSGMCAYLSKNPLISGAKVFLAGLIVTAVTLIFMPENAVVFGVLTLIGSCGIILGLLKRHIVKIPPYVGFFGCIILFVLLYDISGGSIFFGKLPVKSLPFLKYPQAFLGLPVTDFRSTDYFPIFPWIFVYLSGFFLSNAIHPISKPVKKGFQTAISFISKHCLLIYLLHQPVIYVILGIIKKL